MPTALVPAGLVLDSVFTEHDPGPGHPEQVARYTSITKVLTESGLARSLKSIPVREATDDELALVHARDYIELAASEISSGATQLSTGDTSVCPATL